MNAWVQLSMKAKGKGSRMKMLGFKSHLLAVLLGRLLNLCLCASVSSTVKWINLAHKIVYRVKVQHMQIPKNKTSYMEALNKYSLSISQFNIISY